MGRWLCFAPSVARWFSIVKWSAALLGLLGSWCVLYASIGLITEQVLVPWDTVMAGARPVLGSWQRSLNDWFESSAGWLPSQVVIMLSVGLCGIRVWRTPSVRCITALIALNLVGSAMLWVSGIIGMDSWGRPAPTV